jgi:hypothetical protein
MVINSKVLTWPWGDNQWYNVLQNFTEHQSTGLKCEMDACVHMFVQYGDLINLLICLERKVP